MGLLKFDFIHVVKPREHSNNIKVIEQYLEYGSSCFLPVSRIEKKTQKSTSF